MRLSLLHRRRPFPWVPAAKAVILVLPVVLVFQLLDHHYLFTGRKAYVYRPGQPVRVVIPKAAVDLTRTADPIFRWRVGRDTFPFDVLLPREIQGVIIKTQLQPGTQPLLTLTASEKTTSGATTTILNSSFLNSLNWSKVSDGRFTLWQRDRRTAVKVTETGTGKNKQIVKKNISTPVRQYASVAAFQSDPPMGSAIGSVGLNPMAFTPVTDYQQTDTPLKLEHVIRGPHQLYAYVANEELTISLTKEDLNRIQGSDPMTIRVGRADQLTDVEHPWLATQTLKDDGVIGGLGPRGKQQPFRLRLPKVKPGIYLIDIDTTEDVLVKDLTLSTGTYSFYDHVFLAEGPAYGKDLAFVPTTVQFTGSTLTAAAMHVEGHQDIQVNGKRVSLDAVNVSQKVGQLTETSTIAVPKGDIRLNGPGTFTLTPARSLLTAGTHQFDLSTTPDVADVDYLIAEYIPWENSSLITAERTYRVADLRLSTKTAHFSINAPGLLAQGTQFGLKDIRVTLVRGPFPWDKVWKRLGFIHR